MLPATARNLRVVSVQRATQTFGNSTTLDFTISPVDIGRSEINLTAEGADNEPNYSHLRWYFVDRSTVRVERGAASASVTPEVSIEVIQYAGDVRVRNITISNTLGNATSSIGRVRMGHSVAKMCGMQRTGTGFTHDDCNRMVLTDATTVTWTGNSTGSGQNAAGQVIDYGRDAQVRSVTYTSSVSTNTDVTTGIATVPMDRTFLYGNYYTTQSASGNRNILWTYELQDAKTIRFQRTTAGNYNYYFQIYAVTIKHGVGKVRRGSISQAAATGSSTVTVPGLDASRSAVRVLGGFCGLPAARTDDIDDDMQETYIRATISDGSVTFERRASTQSAAFPWEAVTYLDNNAFSASEMTLFLAGTGGGTAWTDSDSETATASESTTLDRVLAQSEAIDASESTAIVGTFVRALSESIDVSEVDTVGEGIQDSDSESINVSETLAQASGSVVAQSESINVGEANAIERTVTTGELNFQQSDGLATYTDNITLGYFYNGVGQTFTGNGQYLRRIRIFIKKTGSPQGYIECNLRNHSGTYGTSGIPGTTILATSTNQIQADDVTTSYVEYVFDFDGTYLLANGTKYGFGAEVTGTFSIGNTFDVAFNSSSSSHDGTCATDTGAGYFAQDFDLAFSVLTTPADTDSNIGVSETIDVEFFGLNDVVESESISVSESTDIVKTIVGQVAGGEGVCDQNLASTGSFRFGDDNAQVAQSFKGDGGNLTRAIVTLRKFNAPTGSITCELQGHTGTYGVNGEPDNSVLETSSTTVNIATLSVAGGGATYQFDFAGTTQLTNDQPYFLVLVASGTFDATNYVQVTANVGDGSAHPGNWADDPNPEDNTWETNASWDMTFTVYSTASQGDPSETTSVSEDGPAIDRVLVDSEAIDVSESAVFAYDLSFTETPQVTETAQVTESGEIQVDLSEAIDTTETTTLVRTVVLEESESASVSEQSTFSGFIEENLSESINVSIDSISSAKTIVRDLSESASVGEATGVTDSNTVGYALKYRTTIGGSQADLDGATVSGDIYVTLEEVASPGTDYDAGSESISVGEATPVYVRELSLSESAVTSEASLYDRSIEFDEVVEVSSTRSTLKQDASTENIVVGVSEAIGVEEVDSQEAVFIRDYEETISASDPLSGVSTDETKQLEEFVSVGEDLYVPQATRSESVAVAESISTIKQSDTIASLSLKGKNATMRFRGRVP